MKKFLQFLAACVLAAGVLFLGCITPAHAAENTLTVQAIATTGTTPSYASANTDGSKFVVQSDERVFLHLKNTNGSNRTVTLVAQTTSVNVPGAGTVTIADRAVVIPLTSGDKMIGPIPPFFVDSDGYAHVTFDAVSGLTIAVVRLARVSN